MSPGGNDLAASAGALPGSELHGDWMLVLMNLSVIAVLSVVLYFVGRHLLYALAAGGHLSKVMARRLSGIWLALLGGLLLLATLQQSGLFREAWAVGSAVFVTVAVGFVASWSVLSNFVCALLIVLFRPFRMGDEIELVNAKDTQPLVKGRVTDLSLMFVTLEESQDDERRIITRFPNNAVFHHAIRVHIPLNRRVTDTFFDVPPKG